MRKIGRTCAFLGILTLMAGQAPAASTLLVVAGGGGGSGMFVAGEAGSGQSGAAGSSGSGTAPGAGGTLGAGGAAGADGSGGGGGGGGVNGPGGTASGIGGSSAPGYAGGMGGSVPGHGGGSGGYGGGGGGGSQGGGGGGGYAGGGGGSYGGGGGGGSYLDGSLSPVAVSTISSTSNGFITIARLREDVFLGEVTYVVTASQTFGYSGPAAQSYTFQQDGLYAITVAGARGGSTNFEPGGYGAVIAGRGVFAAGTMLDLVVGQAGAGGTGFDIFGNGGGGGGGGGSFVLETAVPSAPVTASVPEPATWATMMIGLGAAGFALRRRKDGARATRDWRSGSAMRS